MGGYVTRYEGDFDFLTIRGSGHMVPEYKPEAAFEFMGKWINNKAWLSYNASCTPEDAAASMSAAAAAKLRLTPAATKVTKEAELTSIEVQIAALQEKAAALRAEL